MATRENLKTLYELRRNAIDQASDTIGQFTRMIPPEHHSMLSELAFFALDLASAGIAGGVARFLEPVVEGILSTPESPDRQIYYPDTPERAADKSANYAEHSIGKNVPGAPAQKASRAAVAIVTDGIKHFVKTGGAKVKGAVQGKPEGSTDEELHGAVSVEAKSVFMRQQRDALTFEHADKASKVSDKAYKSLLLGLDASPHAMIASMDAIADALAAAQQLVGDVQVRETVTQWVRLVEQTSAARSGSANVAPRLDAPLAPRDGLIDITFAGNQYDSEAPVAIQGTRVNGINKGVLARLIGGPGTGLPFRSLRDLGLTIRASGMLSGNESSVTVVRDASGGIEYTDQSSRSWFARRVGVMTRATDADQRRGAKDFMEREILNRLLKDVGPSTDAKD